MVSRLPSVCMILGGWANVTVLCREEYNLVRYPIAHKSMYLAHLQLTHPGFLATISSAGSFLHPSAWYFFAAKTLIPRAVGVLCFCMGVAVGTVVLCREVLSSPFSLH